MRLSRLAITAALLLACAAPAFADATLFIGTTTTPSNRAAKGFALGVSLLIVGFEFEYASTSEKVEDGAPSLRTGTGNVFVQTPIAVVGIRPYFITGVGGYRERLDTRQETQIAFNTGGGAKVSLAGPLGARFDYRVFKLRGDPLYSTVHRFYAGLNLAF